MPPPENSPLRPSAPARAYLLFWAALLSIFALGATPYFWRNLTNNRIIRPHPNASTDALLQPLLQVSAATDRLNALFAHFSPGTSILFVSTKDNDRWDFVYSAICYLAWPRHIDRIGLSPNEPIPVNPPNHSVIVYCGVSPAHDSASKHLTIGPNIVVVAPAVEK